MWGGCLKLESKIRPYLAQTAPMAHASSNRSKPSPHDRRPQRNFIDTAKERPLMTIVLSSIGLLSVGVRWK
jgi:hypothetical protein